MWTLEALDVLVVLVVYGFSLTLQSIDPRGEAKALW